MKPMGKAANDRRKRQARSLRLFRDVHRTTGALLFAGFIVVAVTGLLLGWKKNSGGYLQQKTYQGVSTDPADWLSVDSLHRIAVRVLHDSLGAGLSADLDRIDIRQDKGTVKFVFSRHFWGLQLDCTTGGVLCIERRRSDWIEKLHDGSLVDMYLGTEGGQVKLVYTTVMGLALLLFSVTGFWLWYGPKVMRRKSPERVA